MKAGIIFGRDFMDKSGMNIDYQIHTNKNPNNLSKVIVCNDSQSNIVILKKTPVGIGELAIKRDNVLQHLGKILEWNCSQGNSDL